MTIEENNPAYLKDFIRLNEQWISTYFEIEEADRKLAANPQTVIDNGGYIFALLDQEMVVGVCALFNDSGGVYELARMAVDPENQGKGFGGLLMKASLEKLVEIKAVRVHLTTNSILETAIAMYLKYGFEIVSEGQHPIYSRANIIMEKVL